MRVVVCTIVHHPADARIYHRQIRALLDAGHEVRYIAPVGLQDFHSERAGPLPLSRSGQLTCGSVWRMERAGDPVELAAGSSA